MKKIEELHINKIYNEETISNIINTNKNCKAIYTKKIDCYKWGKEKVKLIQIINGYEQKQSRKNAIDTDLKNKITYLILEPKEVE